ncbi:2-dehydropantoate 2-reductase [Methanococcoides sp. SA1]|uniref:2-dehydropantoate 2-reductase n=1 Tax=Candidatus Desulfatifera sulfidica TaxID=2841691 RepID=A0A8J6NBJ3_9BACT|nr:2-dehydropantoate 2-reductase [Candidatus Desulfatifera sulfidica]NPE28509.1 2-dehydropantoate 2-reductase [Methanococcoides sp. SA1]
MRIAIAGPGALGCLLAATLARHDQNRDRFQTLLLDHRPERAHALSDQGIVYRQGEQEERIALQVSASPEAIGPADVLFACVKSPDLSGSLDFCRPLITGETLVVLMQNGIGHLDVEQEAGLPGTPAFMTTTEGATLLAPGMVQHNGQGETFCGFIGNAQKTQQQRLTFLCRLLSDSGLNIALVDDILDRLWSKLLINAGINGLSALYNRTNGQLLTSCAARSRLKRIVAEAAEVARAAGITIHHDPVRTTLKVCTQTAANTSSMLQDVRNKRRTEIMAINGAIVAHGKRLGVGTPHNEKLVQQIKTLESRYAD